MSLKGFFQKKNKEPNNPQNKQGKDKEKDKGKATEIKSPAQNNNQPNIVQEIYKRLPMYNDIILYNPNDNVQPNKPTIKKEAVKQIPPKETIIIQNEIPKQNDLISEVVVTPPKVNEIQKEIVKEEVIVQAQVNVIDNAKLNEIQVKAEPELNKKKEEIIKVQPETILEKEVKREEVMKEPEIKPIQTPQLPIEIPRLEKNIVKAQNLPLFSELIMSRIEEQIGNAEPIIKEKAIQKEIKGKNSEVVESKTDSIKEDIINKEPNQEKPNEDFQHIEEQKKKPKDEIISKKGKEEVIKPKDKEEEIKTSEFKINNDILKEAKKIALSKPLPLFAELIVSKIEGVINNNENSQPTKPEIVLLPIVEQPKQDPLSKIEVKPIVEQTKAIVMPKEEFKRKINKVKIDQTKTEKVEKDKKEELSKDNKGQSKEKALVELSPKSQHAIPTQGTNDSIIPSEIQLNKKDPLVNTVRENNQSTLPNQFEDVRRKCVCVNCIIY